jgi:hypothetical protein
VALAERAMMLDTLAIMLAIILGAALGYLEIRATQIVRRKALEWIARRVRG